MKRLAILVILFATAAFAEDAPKPAEAPAALAAMPAAPMPIPTEWYIRLDQQGINNIAQCAQELPKKLADPFLFAIDAQLKSQPAIIAAIKAK